MVLEYIVQANHTCNLHMDLASTCFGKWSVHQVQAEVENLDFDLDKWHSFLNPHSMAVQCMLYYLRLSSEQLMIPHVLTTSIVQDLHNSP